MSTILNWQERVKVAFQNRAETSEIDFKLSLSEDNERLKEHINGFGNLPSGGLLVFGVNHNFSLTTESIDKDKIIQRLTNLARDTQVPPLQTSVHHLEINGQSVLGIEILPGIQLPVFIKDRKPWVDGAYTRTGNSTRIMTEHEIRDLMAKSKQTGRDSEPVEASIEDLDRDSLQLYLQPFRAEVGFSGQNLDILKDNKVIVSVGSNFVPTLGGWLMFANNPQKNRDLRNASIEFQQFSGRTRELPVRKLEIAGNLPQQVALASSTLLENIWKMPKIQGIRREDVPSYDQTTLREVITNSVVHRDYKQLHQPVKIAMFTDRIEVENPGGLLPGLTPLNLLNKRAWRNKTLANLMAKVGLGEMDGQGIDRIYGAIRRLKIPAPSIEADERTFKIILSGPKAYEEYSPMQKRLTVLVLLILEQEIDNVSVRTIFGIDMGKASNLLKELVEEKMIHRKNKSMKFAKYSLTEDYRQKIGL